MRVSAGATKPELGGGAARKVPRETRLAVAQRFHAISSSLCMPVWRMGWDSNPREACTPAGFQDRCLKPLGHPSGSEHQRFGNDRLTRKGRCHGIGAVVKGG